MTASSSENQSLPSYLSLRDMILLEDILATQMNLYKKYDKSAQQTNETTIKNLLETASQMHKRHFTMLLRHLQPTQQSVSQALPDAQVQ